MPIAAVYGKLKIKFVLMVNLLKTTVSIICHAYVLMSYWAGLFIENNKEAPVAGVNTMLQIATKLLNKKVGKEGRLLPKDDSGGKQKDWSGG